MVTPVDAHLQVGAEPIRPAPVGEPEVGVAQTRLGHPIGGGGDVAIVASAEEGERLDASPSVLQGRK